MTLLNKTTFFRTIPVRFYAYAIFLIVHVALFNINVAEWGDSYRILRASEHIRLGIYPEDEKRPPLFSIFTAMRIEDIDAILWGRVVMFIFSLLTFYVFDKFSKIFIKNEKYQFISLIFFIFNPVYLYWSLRIMADVPFSFFVLLFFYLISRWEKLNFLKLILLGLVCGLAILTRFEGYLLLISGLFAVIFHREGIFNKKIKIKDFLSLFWRNFPKMVILGLTTFILISPWLAYRNPLKSTYFQETQRRIYDFKMVWSYISSILYMFGFTSAFYLIYKNFRTLFDFLLKNIGISAFILLELVLILLWPAAIPRLFVPLIPFFIVLLTVCLETTLSQFSNGRKLTHFDLGLNVFLLLFYIFSQFFLKLQFLMPVKVIFSAIVFLQILTIVSAFVKRGKYFTFTVSFSMILWSLSVIFIHKDIYKAVKSAGIYSRDNLTGKVISNDSTGIVDWYTNYSTPNDFVEGKYWDFSKKESLSYEDLLSENVSHLIVTDEDNVSYDYGIKKLDYLKIIQTFRYNIGSREFSANIFEFKGKY